MSKKIRNIIASVVIIGAFSIIEPNSFNLITTKAYAEENPYLNDIYVSEGPRIDFSKKVYSYIVDVNKDDDEIYIKAKPDYSTYTVKINGQEVTKDNKYSEIVSLDKGKNKIQIEVEDNDNNKSIYNVFVYRGGEDAVYLKDINMNENNIGFDKSNKFYNIELDKGTDSVDLETIAEDGKYIITANGKNLNDTNSIKLKFNGVGKYIITIGVKDEETQRVGTYTLNIYLGIPVSPNVSDSINEILKPNQWVIVNGRWRYNDSVGKCLKNTWFYDDKYKNYYYFNSRGNMQTDWMEDYNNYYYLNSKGEMQTGWLLYGKEWYFLDYNGVMRTGWIEDNNKWYFLSNDGTMETGWIIINGSWYYINSKGEMKTGWLYYGKQWYYLNSNGAMKTGWIKSGEEWYYLNSDGSMKFGEWVYDNGNWYYLMQSGNMRYDNINDIRRGWLNLENDKYYYFNEDGKMRTSPITIDGYTYNFNKDGTVNFEQVYTMSVQN